MRAHARACACEHVVTKEIQRDGRSGVGAREGGATVRHDWSCPQSQFDIKDHGSCIQSAPNSLLKQIQLQIASILIALSGIVRFYLWGGYYAVSNMKRGRDRQALFCRLVGDPFESSQLESLYVHMYIYIYICP